jgi:hypothetical protein
MKKPPASDNMKTIPSNGSMAISERTTPTPKRPTMPAATAYPYSRVNTKAIRHVIATANSTYWPKPGIRRETTMIRPIATSTILRTARSDSTPSTRRRRCRS